MEIPFSKNSYHIETNQLICFTHQLTGFYMIRGFTERYFLTDYSYILEKHFHLINTSDYFFKPLSTIFCVNSSVKAFSPGYEVPSTHLICSPLLCTFTIYRKKEIGFVAKFFSKYFFGPKAIPNYMSS